MRGNTWQARFGAKRRALDRKILAEAEKAIGQDNAAHRLTMAQGDPVDDALRRHFGLVFDQRAAIAQAFGRPLDLMGPPSVLPKDD